MATKSSGGPPAESELLYFGPSTIHGTGAFAKRFLPAGTRVIEYVGERIDKRESVRRCASHNEFIFGLDEEHDLDGNVPWNPARFINHSCAPNCDAENDGGRIWMVANRNINTGEEITVNYGFDLDDYRDYTCRCGSPQCVGYIVAEVFYENVRRQSAERAEAASAAH